MSRRNVLVLCCDQLRPDFLPAYGCSAVPTPNLDRLERRGTVFENAITQSTVCGPARATMMTGRYVSDHGVWTNDVPFRAGLDYLPERMTEAGYRTGAFGKLHHTPPTDTKGFKVAHQLEEGRLGEDEPYLQWLQDRHPEVDDLWPSEGYEFPYDESAYHEHWIASRAIEFLEDHDDRPSFAWVSFQGPHAPYDPPSTATGTVDTSALPAPLTKPDDELADVARYRKARGPDLTDEAAVMAMRTAYAEIIVEIDRQIGRVLDRLEQLGELASTTLVFTADHGDLLGDFGLGAKGPFPYRGQLAVPMLVANHPAIEPGTRSDRLVGTIDLPSTCLDIAESSPIGHSRSLLGQVGPDPTPARDVIYSEFCDSIKTVFDGRHLLSYYPFSDERELYDRATDPDEFENRAGDPSMAAIERARLMDLIDFGVLSRDVHVEAHDLVPTQQAGLRSKHPRFAHDFDVAYPLTEADRESLHDSGLSAEYNEAIVGNDVVAAYAPAYWEGDAPEE